MTIFLTTFVSIVLPFLVLFLIIFFIGKGRYDISDYKQETGYSYFKVRFDKGFYGEYLTFNKIKKLYSNSKVLVNVYIPKTNGTTTEVDLVFIHNTGIYVIESKNYSGWIFGSEKSKMWMQTFPNGTKEKFYNPIWQNNTHIRNLIRFLKLDDGKFKSLIVFSERCKIKKMTVDSNNIKVIQRNNLIKTLKNIINRSNKILNQEQINSIYDKLKVCTQVSEEIKKQHIENIKRKIS